jgi:hypothetical protein
MKCGWTPTPAPATVLDISLCNDADLSATSDGNETYRLLHAENLKGLCDRDVSALITEMESTKVAAKHSVLTVLPTHELVRWQHARAEFIALKILGKAPHNKGVIHSSNAWLYWTHDFRKQHLFIQRVRIFVEEEKEEERHDILTRLLVYAMREAKLWQLPRIVVWEPGPGLEKAVDILKSRIKGLAPVFEARRRETISVRWQGGEHKDAIIAPNEHYAWN